MSAPAAVRERPILFSGPMVRALLDGSKTQTRRVAMHTVCGVRLARLSFDPAPDVADCPHGQPGDRLWVRETFAAKPDGGGVVAYLADGECGAWMGHGEDRLWLRHGGVVDQRVPARHDSWRGDSFGLARFGGRWKPSIHMPRRLSRIALELTDVRVERIRDVSAADCRAEGAPGGDSTNELGWRYSFGSIWNQLNEKRGYGWNVNPWVWVLSFRRVEP